MGDITDIHVQIQPLRQDWKPLSGRGADSQDPGSDSGTGNDSPKQQPLGQPLFPDDTLDRLMDELEDSLPEIPVQGPSEPQIPSPPRAGVDLDKSILPAVAKPGGAAPKPLPTPCRTGSDSISQPISKNGLDQLGDSKQVRERLYRKVSVVVLKKQTTITTCEMGLVHACCFRLKVPT